MHLIHVKCMRAKRATSLIYIILISCLQHVHCLSDDGVIKTAALFNTIYGSYIQKLHPVTNLVTAISSDKLSCTLLCMETHTCSAGNYNMHNGTCDILTGTVDYAFTLLSDHHWLHFIMKDAVRERGDYGIRGGPMLHYGFASKKKDGEWGTMCDDDALNRCLWPSMLCQHLGFMNAPYATRQKSQSFFERKTGPINMHVAGVNSKTMTIDDVPAGDPCTHADDVILICGYHTSCP